MIATHEIVSEIHVAEAELESLARRASALLQRLAELSRWLKRESSTELPLPPVAGRFPGDANLPQVAAALKTAGYVLSPSRGGFIARRPRLGDPHLARPSEGIQ